MKYLILLIVLLSCLTAQDILITDQGVAHKGKYISSTQFYKQLKLKFPEADVSQFINIQGTPTGQQPATEAV